MTAQTNTPFPQVSNVTEREEGEDTSITSIVYTTTISGGKNLNTTVEVITRNGKTYIPNLQTGEYFWTTASLEVHEHHDKKSVCIPATASPGCIPIWKFITASREALNYPDRW